MTYYFPCAIIPNKVKSKLTRVPGSTTTVLRYVLLCPIDKNLIAYLSNNETIQQWELLTNGDPGSRPWLMSNAFHDDTNGHNKSIYEQQYNLRSNTLEPLSNDVNPFVVYAQPNGMQVAPSAGSFDSNSNTGILTKKADIDAEILPEDKFHSKDAGSQYIINQREQSIQDKRDKHAKY